MHKPELSGRLAKLALEISGYDIEYRPRNAIKYQILVDFMAEFIPSIIPEVKKELLLTSGTSSQIWTLFTDGASNAKGSRLGIVLKPPTVNVVRQSIRTVKLTNNEVEYEAMIAGLELAKSLGAKVVEAKCDSFLVLMKSLVEEGHAEINSTSLTWDWGNKYIDYLKIGNLPSDPKESRDVRMKAARVGYYWIDMEKDAKDFVRRCDDRQRYAPMIHQSRVATTFGLITLAIDEMGE
ncbi:PREDICTED: uncharacterized protein LOC109208921 [Nicotiana attenuata]|uniref:uncharacterized protein LOC109208921 n=1 Tax=Nicotiana attenuata TaxID=49451 RepID=UPI00090505F4|nr:PREDICTED: uncharacterized protein LOC109208921 [Nicotiana attenuata]